MKRHYKRTSHLVNSLSHFEYVMRTKIMGDSFKNITSFAVSKGLYLSNTKYKGGEDLCNII